MPARTEIRRDLHTSDELKRMARAQSGDIRPVIPILSGHPFRKHPAT